MNNLPRVIFVFGSNRAGRHGKGAALYAKQVCGAVQGKGEGLQGLSYAIPTKDGTDGRPLYHAYQTLSLSEIDKHVQKFIEFARARSDLLFQVTPVGCGLAGYKHEQVAVMFRNAPSNCNLPPEFLAVLNKSKG